MAEKLKIIPLGGLNEIGKNMTAYEYGGEIIVVDCGMAFPGDDMYGIDCVIPDVTYLVKNRERRGGGGNDRTKAKAVCSARLPCIAEGRKQPVARRQHSM